MFLCVCWSLVEMHKWFDCILFAQAITLDVDLLNKTKHTRQNSTRLLPTILAVVQFNVLLTNQEQQTIISICADNCLSGVFGLVNVCVCLLLIGFGYGGGR